jgi:Zn-dependent peptidase ImmA (M78 family)
MRWGVSMAALLCRAKDLELLSQPAYVNAMKYMSRRGWRTSEPGPQRPVEEPVLLTEALALLQDSGTSFDELVATAHLIAPDDLRDRLGLHTRRALRVEL